MSSPLREWELKTSLLLLGEKGLTEKLLAAFLSHPELFKRFSQNMRNEI